MFPHMYKVRPPRPGRRGEGPPSAECEWQGDTTRRRNSNNRWNPNNLEGTSTPTPSTSTPASPLPATPFAPPFATPPPIPAPPPEAQETLHKMTSPAARLDGVEATNQANFNASPVPWRRERSRTSSPAAAKQTPVRRRERPVSAHSQETDPARVMPSPIPASVSEPAPGKENSSRDSSPAVRRLRQENRSRTNSPRPATPKELPSSRPESASPIPTMEAPAYAKTYTPPVPLEAVVVDATSPQPQTFTTTVPIVIERHTQDQKPEVQRSASPLAAHQLQQKQQRQQTPVQQLHPEDQQQQQQRRRQRSPSSPPEEWGTPQEHLGSSPAFLACRSRTSSPAVAPPQEIQQEEQVIPQQAAEENSRDSRGTSPAVVFQMDCDPPAVGQTPPVEPTKPQENNAIIEDNMLLKDSIPLECYAPMDDLPISTNEFQDIMSTLDMDMDDMDEFRKALEITNDTPLQPPRETSGSPADHAPTHDISSHHRDTITRQLPLGNSEGNRCDIVFASRKAELDALSPEPPIFEFARELTPTPPPTEPDSPLEASPCSSPEVSRIQINGIQKALMETVSQEPTVLKSGRKIIPERSPSCDREPIGDMIRETLESPLITDVLPENGDDDVVVRRAASVLFSPQPPIFEFAQEITPTPSPPGTDSTPCSTPCTSPSIIHSYSDETQKSTLKVISPATPNSGISGRNMSETPPTIEKAPSCLLSEEEDDATVDTGKAHKSTVLLRLKSPEPISSPVQEIRPVSRLSGKESPEESQRHGGAGDVIRTAFRRKALAALSPEPPIFEFARELTPTPPPSEGSLESERGLSASPDPNVSQSQTQMEITEAAGPGPPDFDFARKSISRSEKSDSPAESKQNPRPEIEVCFSPQRTNSSLSRQETPHGVNKNDVSDSRRAALAALSPEPPIFEFARELTPTPPPPGDIPLDMTPVQDSPSLRESEDQTNTVRKVDMNTFSPEPPIFEFAQELPPTPPPEKDFSRAQSMNKDNCPTLLEENTGRFSSKQTTMDSAQLNTPTASSRPNDCAKPGRRAVSALRSPDPPIFEFWHESSPTPSPSISLSNSNASLTESCSSEREDKSKQNGETTAVPFSCNKGYDGDLSEADLSSSSSPESSSSDSVRKQQEPVPSTPRKNQVDDLVIGEDAIVSRRRAILAAFSPEPPIFEFARELTPTPSPTDKDPDFDVTLCASPEVSKNQVNGTEGKYPKEEIPELPIDEVVREITPTPPPSEKDFVSDISMSEDDVSVTLSFDPSSSDVNRDFTPTPTLSDMNPIFDLAMWGSPRDDLIEAHRAAMEVFKAEGLIFDSDEDRTPTPKPSENKHVNGFPTVAEIEGAKQPPQGSELAKVFRERKAAADRRGVEPAAQTLSEDHSPTPKPTLQIPELRPTSIAHPRQRPKESIPVPTPPPSSEPQDVPQSHDGDGSLTKESSTAVGSQKAEKKRNRTRAASPEPPVIAPPPPKSDSPAVWWFDDISQSIPPPPPVMPGKHIPAPPPPPMPGQPAFEMPKLRPMTERKRKTIDCIKKAARGRPDWFSVMKNIEGGVQLRHVDYDQKSDRSRPMLPSSRGRDGQFLYESEKPNQHNALLNQISRGVRLRRVKTNDRSSVDFKSLGMKKFRRQVTVEEKEKKDKEDALPSSSDEEEDIDKMRDDLEATKAQITEELKHRRKAERENKILKIDVDSLNAQIKKLKRQLKEAGITNGPLAGEDEIIPKLEKSMSRLRMREEEEDFSELDNLETEINNLKSQADAHKKVAEDWERKYQNMEQKLQVSETTADEWESRSIYFEKKFRALQKEHNIELPDIGCVGTQTDPADFPPPTPVAPPPAINEDLYAIPRKSSSRRSFSSQFSRMESFKEEDSEDSDRSESEEDDDDMGAEADMEEEEEDGGDDEAAMARKAENEAKRKERDLNLWKSKLTHMKEKEGNVQRERNNLRERIKKYFRDMKTERQEYLKVKADMDELAGVVKEPSEYEESEEEELPPEAEDGVCWFEPAPKKKKLKKRRRRLNADGEEIEDEEEEEDLEDLSLLEEPEWTDSECAESETDNEEEEFNNRLGKLSDRTRKHELHMNKMKKDNYLLKGQVERADEMYLVERRRHQRQDEELHMILAEM